MRLKAMLTQHSNSRRKDERRSCHLSIASLVRRFRPLRFCFSDSIAFKRRVASADGLQVGWWRCVLSRQHQSVRCWCFWHGRRSERVPLRSHAAHCSSHHVGMLDGVRWSRSGQVCLCRECECECECECCL